MLRPTDLQDNFSKAPMAAREQHVMQTRPEQAQHNLARQQDQEHVLDHSRIRPNDGADASENRVDDREKNKQNPARRVRQASSSQETEDGDAAPPRPSINSAKFIDITV
jgi:hypothetical protein